MSYFPFEIFSASLKRALKGDENVLLTNLASRSASVRFIANQNSMLL